MAEAKTFDRSGGTPLIARRGGYVMAKTIEVYGSSLRWTFREQAALWLICRGQSLLARVAPDVAAQLLLHLDHWADELPDCVRLPVTSALFRWASRTYE